VLAPIFDYVENHGYPKTWAPHDLGTYPNAFGRINQPEEDMPVSLGPAPNPYFGWAGYMAFWSIELGSFLNAHTIAGDVVIELAPDVNSNENIPLLVARGWRN